MYHYSIETIKRTLFCSPSNRMKIISSSLIFPLFIFLDSSHRSLDVYSTLIYLLSTRCSKIQCYTNYIIEISKNQFKKTWSSQHRSIKRSIYVGIKQITITRYIRMAELSTLLGFFESKRKRNHSPIKQITITRYIKKEEFSTD